MVLWGGESHMTKLQSTIAIAFLIIVITIQAIWIHVNHKKYEEAISGYTQLNEDYISVKLDRDSLRYVNKLLMQDLATERGKIEKLEQQLAVKERVLEYAKYLIKKEADYIKFLQDNMDKNNLIYPVFCLEEE